MPKIWPVTALGFPGLFTDLGIQAVPSGPQFWLHDTIIPISIVNSQITLPAEAVPVLYNRSDIISGQATAPAINTVIADTGALAAGDYDVRAWLSATNNVSAALALEHRNAANAANIWTHHVLNFNSQEGQHAELEFAVTLLANERFRIFVVVAFGAGETVSGLIMARRRS